MKLSSGAVCRVLNVPPRSLANWVEAGVIRPAMSGDGKGKQHSFDLSDVVAVGVARALRGLGIGLAEAGRVATMLSAYGEDQMREAAAAGHGCVWVMGGKAQEGLFAAEQVMADPTVREVAARTGAFPLLFDVGPIMRKVEVEAKRLERREAKRKLKRGRRVEVQA
jgi:DNA-binding transcriptional MerR regulator